MVPFHYIASKLVDARRIELLPARCKRAVLPLSLRTHWRLGSDLNRQPFAYEAIALPLELHEPLKTFTLVFA